MFEKDKMVSIRVAGSKRKNAYIYCMIDSIVEMLSYDDAIQIIDTDAYWFDCVEDLVGVDFGKHGIVTVCRRHLDAITPLLNLRKVKYSLMDVMI